jgi:DNA adenine methylase
MLPAPFLKWAGGKRQLLSYIEARVPERIDTYFEPFLGGAAVFFRLAARRSFRRAVLADANSDLVDCYQAVRNNVDGVIAALRKYRNDHDQYYRVRAQDPEAMSHVERAARVIYLNRCGYNGLYRVNRSGRFNVPFGRYKRPVICDEGKLRAASLALRHAKLVCGDFTRILREVGPDDFVYFDPPYVPLSATSSFTAYAKRQFGASDQERLADVLRGLAQRKVPALLSNSYCSETRDLYLGFDLEKVPARRSINSVARGRGPIDELLVRSFDYPVAPPVAVVNLKVLARESVGRRRRTRAGG